MEIIVNGSAIDATPIASNNQMAVRSIIDRLLPGPVPDGRDNSGLRRLDFPDDFIFGTGTSAYQVEGAYNKGGKGLSVWDVFATGNPEKIKDGTNGNVACDMYNRYKDDIRMMKQMGLDSYRFSISWPRILPSGRCSGGINREAIAYYNDVIHTVLHYKMIPFVTLFHFDTPYCLEKEYGGFLDRRIKDDFREFADLCFWEFGDRVKNWTTLNEPYSYCIGGYVDGNFPPAHTIPAPLQLLAKRLPFRRSAPSQEAVNRATRLAASGDDDGEDENAPVAIAQPWEAYTVARNLLLCHAEAVQVYRERYQKIQKGQIGIVQNIHWFTPYDENKQEDREAADRATDFMLGWFLEPVLRGDYPESMKTFVPSQNFKDAHFTDAEKKMLQGSIDFLGLNYYSGQFTKYSPVSSAKMYGYPADQQIEFLATDVNGKPIGVQSAGAEWLYVVPKGIYHLLENVNKKYKELKLIYITENGMSSLNDCSLTALKACCNDRQKTAYIQDHLANMHKAMEDIPDLKEKLKGYFLWSWCDNYEWSWGYTSRFGIMYTDYVNDLTRYARDSAMWYVKFLLEPKPDLTPCQIIGAKRRSFQEEEEENVAQPDKRLRAA